MKFELGKSLGLDETRLIEFKEVKGTDPVRSVVNTADEYAVAFLNSDGGRMFWGIRDGDQVVVGVPLSPTERDDVRKMVMNKLHTIQPQIDPTRFELEIDPVACPTGTGELFVVVLTVPKGDVSEVYFTGGHEAFVRVR